MVSSRFDCVIAPPLPEGVRIGLQFHDGALSRLTLLFSPISLLSPTTDQSRRVVAALNGYFATGRGDYHDIPLALEGSEFQRRIWEGLGDISPGESASYGQLAQRFGSGARAVAAACRANPVPLIIPCHRVVAANGIGGYMGSTGGAPLRLKEWLLSHEQGN